MLKNKDIKQLFFIFLGVRIMFVIFQIISMNVIRDNVFSSIYTFMDSSNYLHIAEYGYDEEKYYAFFPLIPILIRILGLYGVVVLNNALAFASSYLMYKMFGKQSSILFLISPIQIYCYVAYTESLFIFLTLLCYYLYKKEKWIGCGICLGLGVCTRSLAAMLFFGMFIVMAYDWIKEIRDASQKQLSKQNIIKPLRPIMATYIPATILSCLYPLYLQIKAGSWKIFVTAAYDWWNVSPSNLFKTIHLDLKSFAYQDLYGKYLISLSFITLAMLCMVFVKYKEIDMALVLYSLFTILSMYSSTKNLALDAPLPPSTSFFRYLLACFPMYTALSKFKQQKFIIYILVILNILISFNFSINGWPF